jgi:2-keto-4-pentenoate hydratase/2-oxohepta-3-ene-1,7-dioic acid hydratase in catechol pathway
MRMANVNGRLALLVDDGFVDVATASSGAFGPSVQAVFDIWEPFSEWAAGVDSDTVQPLGGARLGAPVPRPPQVFAIGLNYRAHAEEGGAEIPPVPMVFTKFPASVAGPHDVIELPRGAVDFEAELVVVIGRIADRVTADAAWTHVAGLTSGQDLSERQMQTAPPRPAQYSLAKSFRGFSPLGPVLVTPDEFTDPTDLEIGCRRNGEQMQLARTSELIHPVAEIIAYLSTILPLLPGDAIFTGTPAGIGYTRDPKILLAPGDVLETHIEGIGTMRHTFAAAL